MSILDILRLVGYTTGTGLYFFLVRLLLQRRPRTETEWTILLLGLSTGLWHVGKMLRALYDVLGLEAWTLWPRTAEAVAFIGLGILPSALLHCHLSYLRSVRGDRRTTGSRLILLLLYIPVLLIPLAIPKLYADPYQPPLQKLSALIVPYTLWDTAALWFTAFLAFKLSNLFPGQRESRLFRILARIWLVLGVAMLSTFALGARHWPNIGTYLEEFVGLSSILPAALLAYYIYRYHYLEIIIRQSFFYAIFATLVAIIYIYGIRSLDQYAQERFHLTPGAIELLMVLALVFAASPIARWIDRRIDKLFASEIGVYRRVAEQIGEEAPRFGVLPDLIRYVEATVSHALELPSVRIILTNPTGPAALLEAKEPVDELTLSINQSHSRFVDNHPGLDRLGASCCVPLWQENELIGLLLVGEPASLLTAPKRTALPVLAAQIAIAVKNCQLIEEKLKLEQQLAERERLALLGQAAASIAHEVKNPLSSVKSIVQVMQEDDHLRSEYHRDLDLIIQEVDRLNRTVTQLLSFSRPSAASGEQVPLSRLIEQAVILLSPEAEKVGVRLDSDLKGDVTLPGSISTATAEILSNLVLNAIQASPAGGTVSVSTEIRQEGSSQTLKIMVTDEGEGISPELRARIFDPFFTTKQRGTGLGLTIVERRLTEIGGSIEIESPRQATAERE